MTSQVNFLTEYDRNYLTEARRQAVRIALEEGQVSADKIQKVYPRPGFVNKNVCGGIFKNKGLFRWVGVKKSESLKRNGGMISIWELVSRESGLEFLKEST